ncbi:hypothetical protein B0T13DRAFT_443494 [Neurospora crassa]|nr:hypothetical protein B0T13DRAFT_443494 [Neurospora crassa]
MADESHHSLFEEAFFANRSREEPFEPFYGDDDDNTTYLIDHFDHEGDLGVDEDDHASIQRNSRSEPDVSDIAQEIVTRHLVYTPSMRNIPNVSPESGADFQDNNLIIQDDAASFIDGTSMRLDNPLSVNVPSTNIKSNHAVDTTADSPEHVLASSALHSHEAEKSQHSLKESNPSNYMTYSPAPLNPFTVVPASNEVISQKLASLHIMNASDRPVATESSTTSVPACFRLPIRPLGRCSVIRIINGFRLHYPCPVWQPGTSKCFGHLGNKVSQRLINLIKRRHRCGIWSCTGCYWEAGPKKTLCRRCGNKGRAQRARRAQLVDEAQAAAAQAQGGSEQETQGDEGQAAVEPA